MAEQEPLYQTLEWNKPKRLVESTFDELPATAGVYVFTQFTNSLKPNPLQIHKKTYDKIRKEYDKIVKEYDEKYGEVVSKTQRQKDLLAEFRAKLPKWKLEYKAQYEKAAKKERSRNTESVLYVGKASVLNERGIKYYALPKNEGQNKDKASVNTPANKGEAHGTTSRDHGKPKRDKHKGKLLLWAHRYFIRKHGGTVYLRWALKKKGDKENMTPAQAETFETTLINELNPDLNTSKVKFVKEEEFTEWLDSCQTGQGLQEGLSVKRMDGQ